jgi:hypothetical protein
MGGKYLREKAQYFIVIILVFSSVYSIFYINKFDIEDNNESIESNLELWLNMGSGKEVEPNILNLVKLGNSNSYIAFFQLENKHFGYAHLIKGWNGKFKAVHAGHGSNIVSYEKIKTDKGIFGILVGKNPKLKIDHIKVKLMYEDFSFITQVSEEQSFLKYKKLPRELKQTFPAELTFYDENNRVIDFYAE